MAYIVVRLKLFKMQSLIRMECAMKIKSINNSNITNGHFLDMVNVSYLKLISLFGEPNYVKAYKTDCEWVIEFENGEIVYIYDWKVGKNYRGEDGLDLYEIEDWHIGGRNKVLSTKLKQLINSEEWSCFDEIRLNMFFTEEYIESASHIP